MPNRLRLVSIVVLLLLVGITPQPKSTAEEPSKPTAKLVATWGEHGSGPGEFDVPIGIAITAQDEVLVSDFYNARVQRFSSAGKYQQSFDVLPNPGAMALDVEGNIYLSHFSAMKTDEVKKPDRVSVYSPRCELLRQWGQTGTGEGEFDYPGGIAISRDGRVYVADQTNRRIQVFDRDGKFLLQWGEYGIGPGQFGGNVSKKSRVGGPQFVALDGHGSVYTTEGSVGRVQKFTAEGKFVAAWGDNKDKPGSFGGFWQGNAGLRGPVGICCDQHARLWITSVGGRVQQFTAEGVFLQGLGEGRGSEPGQFEAPHGIAVDNAGHVYVVDALNHRIQKYVVEQ